MSVESHTPVLFGPDGKSLSLAGELLAPNALNVAATFQLPGKAYPFRWDEAMRDAPLNALAMRRDTFYLSLIQERTAPLVNLDWEVQPDDDSDPLLKLEADTMTRAWRELPDKPGLLTNLAAGGIWFGRVAQQGVWGRTPSGLTNWVAHEPVHGDNVQFSWDNVPIILVNKFTADRVNLTDPAAVVSSSDRGAYGLRLYRPALRNRFIIHKHVREAADYFEGEMAGGVHGVGLRSWLYWGDYIRRDTLAAMLGFMNSVGMMDLICFNYPNGNAEARANAIANAKKITGKIAIVMPRDPMKDFPAVEQISMNTAGVEVMQRLISEYFDKHAERLVVGQSMSAGADKDNGLGGTGRAEFAADTKFQLTKTDALRLGETLTNDWLKPCHGYNFPGSKYGHRLKMVPILDDPKAETKVQNAGVLLQNGVKIEEEELRKAAGFREPREGKPTVGGQQPGQLPGGGDPTNPNAPPGGGGDGGRATTTDTKSEPGGDFAGFARVLDRLDNVLAYRGQPPFPGAVLEEVKPGVKRWVKPEEASQPDKPKAAPDESGGESGRVTSPEADAAAEAKAQANTLKRFGAKVVETAKKVAERAWQIAVELSYHAQTQNIAEDIADTPWDMSKIINAKGTGDWLSTNLGLSGGAAASIGAKVLSYGLTKLKQFLAKRRAAKEAETTANQLDDFGSVVSYAEEPQHPTDRAELAAWIMGRLLAGIGVPEDKCPGKEAFAEQLKDLSQFSLYAKEDAKGNLHGEGDGRFVAKGDSGKGKEGTDRPKAEAAAKGGRATTPKAAAKLEKANAAKRPAPVAKKKDVARQRRIKKAHKVELEFSDSVEGSNLPDSEPADVVRLQNMNGTLVRDPQEVRAAMARRAKAIRAIKGDWSGEGVMGVKDDATDARKAQVVEWARKVLGGDGNPESRVVFFEVKTLQKAGQNRVRNTAKALARKQDWEERYGVEFVTILVDERRGKKYSGHRVYVAPGVAKTTRIDQCEKAESMAAVLKLMGGEG